jgi:hypothetical protein
VQSPSENDNDGAITMQQQSIAFGWKLGAIDILQNTGG